MSRSLLLADPRAPDEGTTVTAMTRPPVIAVSSELIRIVWTALEQGQIDPAAAIRELQALPGGVAALVPFTRHPVPAVRLAAIGAAAACGHPCAVGDPELLACGTNLVAAPGVMAVREGAALAFTLLGGFSLTRGDWRADDAAWERRVAQRVVRFLLLHRDRAVSEDEILDTFWPDRHLDRARRSLHVAISRARRVLDTPGSPSVIEAADRVSRLRLRPSDSVDADQFQTTALAALGEPDGSRLGSLERAASLWGGEPLPQERYTDWALGWRERLIDLHVAVLAALADERLARGDLIAAGRRARELLELDPLNEGAHRRLMVAHARAGRRSHALHQFLACRRALVEQLGLEPASETLSLQRRILAGQPV